MFYEFRDPVVIDADYYLRATGIPESQDDLERSNCDRAGLAGHSSCGWNHTQNLPVFMCGSDPKDTRFFFRSVPWICGVTLNAN